PQGDGIRTRPPETAPFVAAGTVLEFVGGTRPGFPEGEACVSQAILQAHADGDPGAVVISRDMRERMLDEGFIKGSYRCVWQRGVLLLRCGCAENFRIDRRHDVLPGLRLRGSAFEVIPGQGEEMARVVALKVPLLPASGWKTRATNDFHPVARGRDFRIRVESADMI